MMFCDRCRCAINPNLTPMERAVLHWIVRGENNVEIAQRLNRHLSTIKSHSASIRRRFGARNNIELVSIIARTDPDLLVDEDQRLELEATNIGERTNGQKRIHG